jgi:acetyltransferase-like isoleucine patch superfamily enzyme
MILSSIRAIGTGTYIISLIFKYFFRINAKSKFLFHYTARTSYSDRIILTGDPRIKNAYLSFAACSGAYIQAKNGVKIDTSVLIGPSVKIISANHNNVNKNTFDNSVPIELCRNVWIGCNVVILPGVSIGENTIIGAGSVVAKSLPSNVVAVGNPCSIIKELNIK